MVMWGDKSYIIKRMIEANGYEELKRLLADLLYGSASLETRWNNFLKTAKYFGPATISELLGYINLDEYIVVSSTVMRSLAYLGMKDVPKFNHQFTGKKYLDMCSFAKSISAELKAAGVKDYDLMAVNYFLWDEVLPLANKNEPNDNQTTEASTQTTSSDYKSLHEEIKEKLVAIGEFLGFESRSEVWISAGAKVDAVWEAKIGNMGKVIYVFEVQSKGSIDSLVLNLIKAQKNAAVQAVVAVADREQLAKIISEGEEVINKTLFRTWDSEEVLAVYDSLARVHESINKLGLVPESFKR